MALFGHGQKTPAERLVLGVVLGECQGRDGLGHLVTEVERMRLVELGVKLLHLCKQLEWVGAVDVHGPIDDVNLTAFGE